jgi:hypothetical protein
MRIGHIPWASAITKQHINFPSLESVIPKLFNPSQFITEHSRLHVANQPKRPTDAAITQSLRNLISLAGHSQPIQFTAKVMLMLDR